MDSSTDSPTPPEDIPDSIAVELRDLPPDTLRNTILYARELLAHQHEPDISIEPSPNEDILRIKEHEGYTEVVKQISCADGCSDCPHGPYLYHVTEEDRPEGGSHLHWSFIGPVVPSSE